MIVRCWVDGNGISHYNDDDFLIWPYTPSTTGGTYTWPSKPDCFKAKNPCKDCRHRWDCENAKISE